MPIEPSHIKRLSLIRYVYTQGIQSAKAPGIYAMPSILLFHDAVEMLFVLVLESHNLANQRKPKGINFLDYFDIISNETGKQIGFKQGLNKLNEVRVSIKHHGILPETLMIESISATVSSFFEETVPLFFDCRFSDISLIAFIEPDVVREKIRSAQLTFSNHPGPLAFAEVAVGFDTMIHHYTSTKSIGSFENPFQFGQSNLKQSADDIAAYLSEHPEGPRFFKEMASAVSQLQEGMRLLSLNIDVRKYLHFKSIVPKYWFMGPVENNKLQYHPNRGVNYDESTFNQCIDFVVESSLRLFEFDYEVYSPFFRPNVHKA